MAFVRSQTEAIYHKDEKIEFHSEDRLSEHSFPSFMWCTTNIRETCFIYWLSYQNDWRLQLFTIERSIAFRGRNWNWKGVDSMLIRLDILAQWEVSKNSKWNLQIRSNNTELFLDNKLAFNAIESMQTKFDQRISPNTDMFPLNQYRFDEDSHDNKITLIHTIC